MLKPVLIAVAAGTLGALVALGSCVITHKPTIAQTAVAPSSARTIADAKSLVLTRTKNPASARFGKVWIAADGFVCGSVNSHNGYGAYAGDLVFVITPSGELHFPREDGTGWTYWTNYCQ